MVSDEFIEKLEVLAFQKKKCQIMYSDEGGRVTLFGIIEGIYDREGRLCLQLQTGQLIPVENLVMVDSILVEGFC
jgi:hypothetical protein